MITNLFSSLYEIWQAKLPGYYLSALSIFYRILFELEHKKNNEDYLKIKPAADYLHKNYTDPALTVSDLSAKCYMSDTYFRRLFQKVYGRTPLSYLIYLRVEHAKALLSELGSSVSEVASASGFTDVKYFSTVFKKTTGTSPSKYR